MKRIGRIIAVIAIVYFVIAANAYAGKVEQAEDFIKARMWPQAIAVLKEEIRTVPKNAKAHFLLGTCYANTGDYSSADERFESAVALKADYGYTIGEEYKKVGLGSLNNGEVGKAKELFERAERYQPGIKQIVAAELLTKGKDFVAKNFYEQADKYFTTALSLNPNLNKDICNVYFNPGDPASEQKDFDFFTRIEPYCGMFAKEIGGILLSRAKELARKTGMEQLATKYKEAAVQYLGSMIVKNELPEIREYGEGIHVIDTFKAGEQTPFWLGTKIGTFSFEFLTTKGNKNFTVVTNQGEKFRYWNEDERKNFLSKQWGDELFRIEFHEDMEFGLKVKNNIKNTTWESKTSLSLCGMISQNWSYRK